MNKAEQKAQSLLKYIQENPEQRFWQALRNWSKYNFILKADLWDYDKDEFKEIKDTFYLEDN